MKTTLATKPSPQYRLIIRTARGKFGSWRSARIISIYYGKRLLVAYEYGADWKISEKKHHVQNYITEFEDKRLKRLADRRAARKAKTQVPKIKRKLVQEKRKREKLPPRKRSKDVFDREYLDYKKARRIRNTFGRGEGKVLGSTYTVPISPEGEQYSKEQITKIVEGDKIKGALFLKILNFTLKDPIVFEMGTGAEMAVAEAKSIFMRHLERLYMRSRKTLRIFIFRLKFEQEGDDRGFSGSRFEAHTRTYFLEKVDKTFNLYFEKLELKYLKAYGDGVIKGFTLEVIEKITDLPKGGKHDDNTKTNPVDKAFRAAEEFSRYTREDSFI